MSLNENTNPLVLALAGNPNAGKTTIFNLLTGARQHVGNYPGVTVEKKEGRCRHAGREMNIVDLPGTYSLTAGSLEETVARDFLLRERPDVVVDVVDATNLERNLYLAVQMRELGLPLVLAFNMSDLARERGLEFDLQLLSRHLGARIVPTVGHRGVGREALLEAALATAQAEPLPPLQLDYGPEGEAAVTELAAALERADLNLSGAPSRWTAVKLLENDPEVESRLKSPPTAVLAAHLRTRLEGTLGESAQTLIAEHRYGFIAGACREAVRATVEARQSWSDRIDAVVTHRVLALPIFLGLMYLVFQLTFTLGDPPMGWIEAGFGWLGEAVAGLWPADSESALKSLLVDGLIGGVGGVVIFLPNILLLFLAISLLEDSGYMARAAFIMDRLMHRIGLHGKSFIPLLIGFGCSVPAIMATRTLENRRDRLTTMLVAPLMSCGARLPIYALIIPAFFAPAWQAPILWLIYVIGIVLAVVVAKLLRSTILPGESVPFVMELPPYRLPTLKGVLIHMAERGWLYLQKAGTIILGISILLWAATAYPKKATFERDYAAEIETVGASGLDEEAKAEKQAELEHAQQAEELAYTVAGRIGHGLEPVLRPLGFDWRIGTALIGAFAAKEVFVAQMGIVYSVGEADEESDSLRERLRQTYTPLTAFCIMIFCLVSAPCMATIAVTRRESGSWGWALFQLAGLTVLAYVLTLMIYQVGLACNLGTT